MSLKEIIYESINNDICCRCNKPGSKLVSPCGNNDCDARIHKKCIIKQIEENNHACLKCSQPVISNKVNKLDLNECCVILLRIFSVIFLYIVGLATPPLLMFGSVINGQPTSDGVSKSYVFSIILSIIIDGAFITIFGAIDMDSFYFNRNQDLYLCTKVVAIFTIDGIILFCHFIGFFVMKYYFDSGNHFDPASFISGLVVTLVILIIGLIICGIIYGCYLLYNKNLKEVTVYGV